MSSMGSGYVGIAKETTFGTAVAPTVFLPVQSAEASTDPQNYIPEEIRGSRARHVSIQMGRKHEASLELDGEPQNLGIFLLGALGNVTTTPKSGTPAAYEHVFTGGDTLPSFSLELRDPTMIRRVGGAKIDTLTLSLEAGSDGVLKVSADLLAKSVADQAAATATNYIDKQPFVFYGGTVTKGGVASTSLKSFELEITNNIKDDAYVIGTSQDVQELPEGIREVNVSLEMLFRNKIDYQNFIAGQSDSLTIVLQGGLISGANYDQLKIELPNIVYSTFDVPMDGPDGEVIASLEGVALYNASSAFDAKFTLTNTVASY